MPRQKHWTYWRSQGGARRAYADLRAFADVGGRREPLIEPGQKLATTDATTAQVLLARRLEQLEAARRDRTLLRLTAQAQLAPFARLHLVAKKESGKFTDQHLAAAEKCLIRAVTFFGADRDLATITVADVRAWSTLLQKQPNGRGGKMSAANVRHHLNSVSNLYRRARAERVVPSGYDPVGDFDEKPTPTRQEAKWLEIHDAALLLESARTFQAKPSARGGRAPAPYAYPLLAAFLLTGGRPSEVLGLEVGDVSFDRKTITFRPNNWRRLKTATSFRSVPMWPHLEEILRPYVFSTDRPPSTLLFPSFRTGQEAMLTDARKLLDAVAGRVGYQRRELNLYVFRHTYCAARLQTLDGGAPVSPFTVARELGHGGEAMVRKVYGHLGQVRHRTDVVEYRVEQHVAKLEARLTALRGA